MNEIQLIRKRYTTWIAQSYYPITQIMIQSIKRKTLHYRSTGIDGVILVMYVYNPRYVIL